MTYEILSLFYDLIHDFKGRSILLPNQMGGGIGIEPKPFFFQKLFGIIRQIILLGKY